MGKSKDMVATDAIAQIKSLKKHGEIKDFTKGDARKTVLDAAGVMEEKLKTKKSFWPFGRNEENEENKKEKRKKKETPSR